VLVLALSLCVVAGAWALPDPSINSNPDPIVVTGLGGATLPVTVTLTNTSDDVAFPGNLYLNGSASSTLPGLTVDTTLFDGTFAFGSGFLAGKGGAWTGDLFEVGVDPALASGDYAGNTFDIYGGPERTDFIHLGTVTFTVSVSSEDVPEEPGLAYLFGLVAVPLGLLVRRRRGV
jgi:hypothetical protein